LGRQTPRCDPEPRRSHRLLAYPSQACPRVRPDARSFGWKPARSPRSSSGLHPFAHNGVARRRTLARLGEPSGDQHDQWIPQFFLRYVHAGLNLQESIDTPAWHTEHSPRSSGRARHDPVFWSPKKTRPFGHRRGTAPTRSSRRNRTRLVGGASGRRRSLPAMLNDRSGGYRRRKDGPNACSRGSTRPLGAIRCGDRSTE
jgi:hypothetical protein